VGMISYLSWSQTFPQEPRPSSTTIPSGLATGSEPITVLIVTAILPT
jgi:hypothetical protein